MRASTSGAPGRIATRAEIRTVVLLCAAVTLLMTYPLWLHPASRMLPSGPDGELFVWTLSWDAHAFLHQPLAIFDANIYYPFRDTLAFSENLIGTAIFSAPVEWLTGNPVLALNVVSLLSTILCGVGAWLLARRLGLGQAAAVIAGLVFAFAPPRFFRMEQMHLAPVQWIPFGLASLHAYLDGGRPRDLKWTACFFTLEALSSGHGAVFMLVACGGLFVWRVALGDPLRLWRRVRDLGVTGVLLLTPVVWSILPYRRVQESQGLRRPLANWIVDPSSFIAAPTYVQTWVVSHLPDAHVLENATAYLFPGFLTLILVAAALILRPAFAAPAASGSDRLRQGSGGPPKRSATAEDPGQHHDKSVGRGFSPGVSAASARTTRAVWLSRGAVLLELLALSLVVLATLLTIYRPARVRVGDIMVLSTHTLWRPWLAAAVFVAARAALVKTVPFDTPQRAWRLLSAGLAAGLAVWRRLSAWITARVVAWRLFVVRLALNRSVLGFYGALTLLTIFLSLGPPLGIWPYVYWMPGLNFIRAPSRFSILGMLGLAILAAIGFERVLERLRPGLRRTAAVVVSVLLVAEFIPTPIEGYPYRVDAPPIDRWLATEPGSFAIAEVPLPDPGDAAAFESRQCTFMMHASAHWQKTVHGYSGIRAPLHEDLYVLLREFPSDASLRRLAELGVSRVVVHTDLYEPREWPAVEARIGRFADRLQLEHVEGAGRVYALRPSAPSAVR